MMQKMDAVPVPTTTMPSTDVVPVPVGTTRSIGKIIETVSVGREREP